MGLFDKIKEPVFLKESSAAAAQVEKLQALAAEAPAELKAKIDQDIKMLQAGIYGEETIEFELKNSHIPMMVLHDLYLTCGDLSAQIDYLIVTRKRVFVVECKNLIGSIEIDNGGNFIRTIQYGRRTVKEGIYSPLTQNKRHLELLRQLRREAMGNIFTKAMFDRHFYDNYRSVVVLANPKTVLNARYAKKEVKQQVIRADQLIEHINKVNAEPGSEAISERQMEEMARFFLSLHRENPADYAAKYRELLNAAGVGRQAGNRSEAPAKACAAPAPAPESPTASEQQEPPVRIVCPRCGAPMVMRKAAKGANAGKTFYGCSRFPHCKGIVNIHVEGQAPESV